jgi:hypothetical protein
MSRYGGRRTFSEPVKASELNEFAGDVVRALETPDGSRRWRMLDVVRGDSAALLTTAPAAFDATLPVDTANGATISVQFPPVDSRNGGRELSIIRKSTAGVMRLIMPTGAKLDGSTAVTTAPTTVGRYTYEFDGVDYWSSR